MLLTEDRVSQVKVKYQIPQDIWDPLVSGSKAIAPNHKYLAWLGGQINSIMSVCDSIGAGSGYCSDILIRILTAVANFDKWKVNFQKKDLYQYKTYREVEAAIDQYKKEKTRNIITHDESEVVYEDDRFKVVVPRSHDASCYYGAGTKWCTSSVKEKHHFSTYDKEGKLFYILDKQAPTSSHFYKVALNKTYKGGEVWWDALDKSIDGGLGIEHILTHKNLIKTIKDYFQFAYAEDIAKITEKEKQKELERLEREEVWARRRRQAVALANASAEERREEDAWNVEDTDKVGMAANALMEWLKNEDIWEDNDDGVVDLEAQISNLRVDMEEDPEVIEDPSGARAQEYGEDLNNLEEELEVTKLETTDVYHIHLETYDHYGLSVFSYEGGEYAVGDDGAADIAAHDQVEVLVEDLGFEGFGGWVIENNIDSDAVVEYFRYSIEQDVYECPECWLDEDNDKILSSEGKTHQRGLEEEIGDLQEQLDDEDIDENEKEDITTRIEDLETEIEDIEYDDEWMEWDEEKMESKIEERLEEIKNSPTDALKDFGVEGEHLMDFINVEGVVEDVINADGRGNGLSGYDGTENEVVFNDTWWYIYRIN